MRKCTFLNIGGVFMIKYALLKMATEFLEKSKIQYVTEEDGRG
jgi:hypothetical protein